MEDLHSDASIKISPLIKTPIQQPKFLSQVEEKTATNQEFKLVFLIMLFLGITGGIYWYFIY